MTDIRFQSLVTWGESNCFVFLHTYIHYDCIIVIWFLGFVKDLTGVVSNGRF